MGSQHSSGIATIMFTDLEGSTDTTTRLGDEAAAAFFSLHDRILRGQFAAHGGRRVKSTGDGFLVLFDSARSAVACALAIQRELAEQEDGPRVRIGVGAGEVDEGGAELFGAAINLASRVMDRARGGEILVTETVRQLVGTMPGAHFRDRGRVALKGFPERQRLHELRPAERPQRPRPAAPRRRSRRRVFAAAVLGLTAVAVAVFAATRGGEEAVDAPPNSVAILDPEDGRVTASVPVGVDPGALAAGAGSVWVANQGDKTVTQIGARSRRVAGTISPGIDVDGLAVGPSGVWVAESGRTGARVIDPAFRTVARSVRTAGSTVPEASRPIAVTADAAWIASFGTIERVDPRNGHTVATIDVGNGPSAIAVGAGGVWLSDDVDGTLTRIDPEINEVVERIPVGESASGVAIGAGGVWVPVPLEDRVKRIDPTSNSVAETVRVAGGPGAVAIGAGGVWVAGRRDGTVTRIDPGGGDARVTRTVRLGHSPQGIAVVDGAVWVALQAGPPRAAPAGGAPDVLRVARPEGLFAGTDPLFAFASDQIQYATCAQLFNYPDRPFPEGAELQPEVAAGMPAVSDGGRAHTIRLRTGFRFSPPSNAPVTAQAFERALERGVHPRAQSYAAIMMSDIVGAADYAAGHAKRIAGVTARGNTLTIRLTSPSQTLPARLASKFFCAVPPATPISGSGVERIPMAGPYYIASYVPKQHLVLRRNPNYRGDRPARMREIEFDLDVSRAGAVSSVEAGRADYLGAVPAERVAGLDREYGPRSAAARAGRQRYFSGAAPVLHYFAFNTRRQLFAPTRTRQAVSAALDRRALAARVPAPPGVPGRPTDQFIPPGLPGFRDAAIWPLGGPDVVRARRLAGKRRRRSAVLYTCSFPACLEQGRIVRRNLAAIGIDVEVVSISIGEMFERLEEPGEPWDIAYSNNFIGTADPSEFVETLFGAPELNPGGFADERLQRRIRTAMQVPGAARERAFAALDADLSRAAAAAPFATAVTTDFFSDRIGCQVHQPIYGTSLGALCLRD